MKTNFQLYNFSSKCLEIWKEHETNTEDKIAQIKHGVVLSTATSYSKVSSIVTAKVKQALAIRIVPTLLWRLS